MKEMSPVAPTKLCPTTWIILVNGTVGLAALANIEYPKTIIASNTSAVYIAVAFPAPEHSGDCAQSAWNALALSEGLDAEAGLVAIIPLGPLNAESATPSPP
jgi:hypothetical protein